MVESAFERASRSNNTERLSSIHWSLGSQSRNQLQTLPSHEHNEVPRLHRREGDASEAQPDARIRIIRKQSSMLSATSSIGSQSAKSPSPLDNPSFAPPPPRPIKTNHIMSQFMAEHEPERELPSYEKITHSGTCLSRISLMSLMIRRWKRTFWITYGKSSLMFFRSEKHYEDWLTNPYLSTKERIALVKLHVNFITDFDNDDIQGFQVSRIKSKWYTNGGVLHNFKLDKWFFDGGPTIAGAFASTTHENIDDLHTIMQEMAKRSPKNKRFLALIAELAGYGTDHSGTEGMSVRSIPQYTTMFSDDIYYTPRQTEAFMGMKSAASC